jgi:hypothetical protein
MKSRTIWLAVVLLAAGGGGYAQERVSLAEGRLSFEVPDGFRPLTAEEIALKYPNGNPPGYAYANERADVSIAVQFSAAGVAPSELPRLQASMEQTLPRVIPGLQWLTREIVEIDGRGWVHLELTSFAVDTDIHNHMYLTSFDGRMLGINMNSTVGAYEGVRAALGRTRDSIRVVD